MNMPASLFNEWLAYDQMDPISAGFRGDVNAAMIIAALQHIFLGKKGASRISDLMPRWDPLQSSEIQPSDPRLLYKKVRTMFILMGAKPPEKGKN